MNNHIQGLLARKAKADSLPAEVRQQYIKEYHNIVFELIRYSLSFPLPVWDEYANSIILSSMFQCMAKKYEILQNRLYINWMYSGVIPEIDASFEIKDSNRFYRCIQTVRQQLSKI